MSDDTLWAELELLTDNLARLRGEAAQCVGQSVHRDRLASEIEKASMQRDRLLARIAGAAVN